MKRKDGPHSVDDPVDKRSRPESTTVASEDTLVIHDNHPRSGTTPAATQPVVNSMPMLPMFAPVPGLLSTFMDPFKVQGQGIQTGFTVPSLPGVLPGSVIPDVSG